MMTQTLSEHRGNWDSCITGLEHSASEAQWWLQGVWESADETNGGSWLQPGMGHF